MMYAKNRCLVCDNDDSQLFSLVEAGECCEICGSEATEFEIIEDTEDFQASFEKLF